MRTDTIRIPLRLPGRARIVGALSRAWQLLGLTLLCFLVAETTAQVVFLVRDALRPQSAYIHGDWSSEVFARNDWIRAYADEYERSRVFEWHPYVYWRAAPFQGRLVNVAAGGTRQTWSTNECRAGGKVARVFMFGGSSLWGVGARDDFTIPSWVARKLAERGHRHLCVANWGESGYVSTQEVLTLLLQLRNGHVPDLVVFYDGVNDIAAAYQSGTPGIPQNEFNRRAEFNLTKRAGEMLARGGALAAKASGMYRLWSGLWRGLLDAKGKAQGAPSEPDGGSDEVNLADAIVSTYAANAEIARRLGREYGFKALFYWQPVAFVSKPLTADEVRHASHERYLEGLVRRTYARLVLHQALVGRGDFRDLSGLFRDVEASVFIDFAHKSEAANERVAEEIVEDVIKFLDSKVRRAAEGGRPVAARPQAAASEPRSKGESRWADREAI